MRHEVRELAMPATGVNGTARACEDLEYPVVAVDGAGAAAFSLKVQAKVAGIWVDLDAAVTATKAVSVADANGYPYPASHVRIVSTTTGSPAPTANVAGYNHRSD